MEKKDEKKLPSILERFTEYYMSTQAAKNGVEVGYPVPTETPVINSNYAKQLMESLNEITELYEFKRLDNWVKNNFSTYFHFSKEIEFEKKLRKSSMENVSDIKDVIILGWILSKVSLSPDKWGEDPEKDYKKIHGYINMVIIMADLAPNILAFFKHNLGIIKSVMSEEETKTVNDMAHKWVLLKYRHYLSIADRVSKQAKDKEGVEHLITNIEWDHGPLSPKNSEIDEDFDLHRRAVFIYQTMVGGGTPSIAFFQSYIRHKVPNTFYFCCEMARLENKLKEMGIDFTAYGIDEEPTPRF